MHREPVGSTSVRSIGYDPLTMILEVEFSSGTVYQYFDVPEGEYARLTGAESIGHYLNRHIKWRYRYARV